MFVSTEMSIIKGSYVVVQLVWFTYSLFRKFLIETIIIIIILFFLQIYTKFYTIYGNLGNVLVELIAFKKLWG